MPVLFPKSNSCLFLSVKILKNAQILFKIGNYVLKTSDFDNYWPKWCNKAKVLEISDQHYAHFSPLFSEKSYNVHGYVFSKGIVYY